METHRETAPALYYTICIITIPEVSRVVLQFQKHMSFPKFVDIACHVVTLNFAELPGHLVGGDNFINKIKKYYMRSQQGL